MTLFKTTTLCLAATTASVAVGTTASAQANYFANGGFEDAGTTAPAFGWVGAAAG